ncbi:hypothetical protein Tsubulata_029353 [Turnera subulata]|uniref:Pulmonary surfactant-associated protein B n=1 Tax=Turnera subulata TaxID=218843 RepID=A0A9Q0JDQ1_9ROSI|nr:hypothetical protein Tsubulata_029353 [Turnera subulata]
MGLRIGLACLLIMSVAWACAAREIASAEIFVSGTVIPDTAEVQMISGEEAPKIQVFDPVSKKDQICTLCEEFATQALGYLAENKTQTDVITILHKSCSRIPSFKEQCITLVDYYAPLFFVEVSTIQPQDFCRKVNLCQHTVMLASERKQDSCQICQHAISEVLLKLKDPDTQLEIIELLLKACNSMDNYARKCKKMVFEYGPLVLANAEQFLETTDVCTVLHACNAPKANVLEQTATVLKDDLLAW